MSNRFLRAVYPAAIDAWPQTRRRILPAPPGSFVPSFRSLADSRIQTSRGFSQLAVALSQADDSSAVKEIEDEEGEDEEKETRLRRYRTTDDYKRAGPPVFEQDDDDNMEDMYPPSKTIRIRRFPRNVENATLDQFLAPYVGVVRYRKIQDLVYVDFIDVESAQAAMEVLKRRKPALKRIDGPAKWGDHVPRYSYEPAPPELKAFAPIFEMELHGIGTADTNEVARHLWGLGIVAQNITINPDKPGTCTVQMQRASEIANAMGPLNDSKMVHDDDTETTISVTTSVDLTRFQPTKASDSSQSYGSRGAMRGGFRGAPRGRAVRGRGRGRGDYQRYSQNDREASQSDHESSTAESAYGRGRGRGSGHGRGSTRGRGRGRGRGASYAPRDNWTPRTEDARSPEGGNSYRGRGGRGRSPAFGATRGRGASYAPQGDGTSFRGGPSRGRGRGRGRGDPRRTEKKSGWKAELQSLQEGA